MFAELDFPRYATATVAKVAGIPVNTLRTWLDRGQVAASPIEGKSPGTGRSLIFSARRTLHIALMVRLAPFFDPKESSRLAVQFTDIGSDDNPRLPGFGPGVPNRAPGELIEGATRTVLRVLIGRPGEPPTASVERLEDIAATPFIGDNKPHQVVLLLDLDDLRARVMAALESDR